jgi:hypothetical protein
MSTLSVYESLTGRKIEIDSSELIRTADGGYAIRNGTSMLSASTLPTPIEDGPAVSIRLGQVSRFDERLAQVERLAERVARLDERLAGLERRVHAEGIARRSTIVRDADGRIIGVVSEPAAGVHQPLVRNQ